MKIDYRDDYEPSPKEFITILEDSTLAKRRPVNDYNKIVKMIKNADIIVTAWIEKKLIGIARCITDYGFCTYLSDVAVHQKYQRQGIGKELIRRSRQIAGNDVNYFLFAAPAAKEYYQKIGFTSITRGWILKDGDSLN